MLDLEHPVSGAYVLAGFALIVISAMMCWTVRSTDSGDRADLVRAFAELLRTIFDGLSGLRGNRPDGPFGALG